MNSAQRTSRISPLVEAMVSGEQRAGVGGILVNDLNGLCLVSKGNMKSTNESINSGVYTSLAKLASTLTPCQNNENPPLITIEMEGPSSILIKEYDGHTVAMKVPNKTETKSEVEGV